MTPKDRLLRPQDRPPWLAPLVDNVHRVPDAYRRRVPPAVLSAITGAPSAVPGTRDAAVLVLFSGPHAEPDPAALPADADLLLTVRAGTLRHHAGQAAFPGGAADPEDAGPVHTALREAREETGLDPGRLKPLATLERMFIPPSGFHVVPVLAYSPDPGPVTVVDESETAIVARVPLRAFVNPENRLMVYRTGGDVRYVGPAFLLNEMLVWGFTGHVISAMLDVAGWAQPWDADNVRELDEAMKLVGGDSEGTVVTGSQWLDIAVIVVALIAAISGWRSGALGSLMSFVGVVLGAIAGVMLAPHIVSHVHSSRGKLFTALFLILALVVIGEVAGVVLGRAVRGSIRSGPFRVIDSVVGVALQLVVVLIAAWLLGSPLTSSSQQSLAAAAKGSRVISEVDKYAPQWLRSVPKRISTLLSTSGLPEVLQPLGGTPVQAVDPPDASLADSLVVSKSRPSVVKIRGVATGCQKVLEGTGFVIAPNRVMSNAHVVAGSDSVTVEAEGKNYDATVVSYDPNADISILDVPNLPQEPLVFAEEPAKTGTDAVVLGYPGGGEFAATPARVREIIELSGPDIYKTRTVNREVYTIRGPVRQGNSGGPMINRAGKVIGVVFGAAVDDNDTGFVMTTDEVSRQLAKIGNTAKVPTGACVNG